VMVPQTLHSPPSKCGSSAGQENTLAIGFCISVPPPFDAPGSG
jgi:hypothetical protein